MSGKDQGYAWESPKITEALTPEQQTILEQRGVLSPEEIHRLAGKTRRRMGAQTGQKADCHSDHAEPDEALELQERIRHP